MMPSKNYGQLIPDRESFSAGRCIEIVQCTLDPPSRLKPQIEWCVYWLRTFRLRSALVLPAKPTACSLRHLRLYELAGRSDKYANASGEASHKSILPALLGRRSSSSFASMLSLLTATPRQIPVSSCHFVFSSWVVVLTIYLLDHLLLNRW